MASLSIVEYLYVLKYCTVNISLGFQFFVVYVLHFQARGERLHCSVIPAIALTAHVWLHFMTIQHRTKAGHWKRVVYELETDHNRPCPVRRVEIDKPDGSKRPLSIPCVIDRIIQQAIAQVLTPLFDPNFSESIFFGFRPRRSALQAVTQVHSIIKSGRRFAVDVDLSKFFDRVNHDLLMSLLGRKVRNKRVLRLIKRYLRAGVIDNQLFQESRFGVPQGGPLSPLLSNVMLDPLDKNLERRGHQFARYADDFTILVKSQRAGERVLDSISRFLQIRLKLVVNTT